MGGETCLRHHAITMIAAGVTGSKASTSKDKMTYNRTGQTQMVRMFGAPWL